MVYATEIVVARHGETDWNNIGRWQGHSDVPLNSNGVDQSRKLAREMLNRGIRYVYSSDLKRARMTAEIVRKRIGAHGVYELADFRERGLGRLEGWSLGQVARYMGISLDDSQRLEIDELSINSIPGVEDWDKFVERIWKGLSRIAEERQGIKSLLVAHGGVMRAIRSSTLEGSEQRIVFENAEFFTLSHDGRTWRIEE